MANTDSPSLTHRYYSDHYFHSRYQSDLKRDVVWSAICGYLQRFISDQGTVLDIGAGYCSFINQIQAAKKHALDIFPGFVKFAHSNVQTHIGPCHDLRVFEPKQFDTVFASNLLEHLTREEAADLLQEIRRILKITGRLILLQPNFRYSFREYFDDYTHLQIFTHVGLANLLTSSGFALDHIEPRFLPFSFKSRLPKWRWLVALYLRLPFRPLAKQMLLIARPV